MAERATAVDALGPSTPWEITLRTDSNEVWYEKGNAVSAPIELAIAVKLLALVELFQAIVSPAIITAHNPSGSLALTGSPSMYEYRFQLPGSAGDALALYASGLVNLPSVFA